MNNSDSLSGFNSTAPRANDEPFGNGADDAFNMPETPVSQEDMRKFFPYLEFEMPPFKYDPNQAVEEDSVDVDAFLSFLSAAAAAKEEARKNAKTQTNADSESGLHNLNSDSDMDQNSQERRILGSDTGSTTSVVPSHPNRPVIPVSSEQRHDVDAQESVTEEDSMVCATKYPQDGGSPFLESLLNAENKDQRLPDSKFSY
ncbi:hypothetical protein L218DRAFT_991072 [Marasmius fiardii PR-910]|nr:hypothetical protein L218DRAFT_991072 [Marasmius fiardii PR-910]